jgi:hypothetical protein
MGSSSRRSDAAIDLDFSLPRSRSAGLFIPEGKTIMSTKPKLVIDVSGGVVQAVFTDADMDVILVDWDAEGCVPGENNVVEVDGKCVHAVHYPTSSMSEMPEETAEAVGKAS